MNPNKLVSHPLILLNLALLLFAPVLQAEVTVRVSDLRGPLHLLQGAGGNVVASVGDDGVLLIDDDYADNAVAYDRAVTELSGSKAAPRFLLNTHWHADHTGGNAFWGERGVVIMAHENVRERMSTQQNIKALGMVVEPSPPEALPVVTYADSIALYFNGSEIEVQHYAGGHTDGDSVIYFLEENLVHMGDLFFKDAFPFVDISSGGGVDRYIGNVEQVLLRVDDNTQIVPGHGSLASKEDLQRYLLMLKTTSSEVRAALAKGESVEDITARGLGDQWQSWGKGFINEPAWIATIAASP